MKGFLFDENLPRRIRLAPSLPIIHVATIGVSPQDGAVWDYAKTEFLAIVSKETDFSDRILVSQPPPRVVHLRIGNLLRADFHAFVARAWPQIEALFPAHDVSVVRSDSCL